MILNIEEIFGKLTDNENWEPIEFINHRREMLRFEKIATIELDGNNYAYLYEIDDDGEHITDFPAIIRFGKENDEYIIDFVTDKNIVEDVIYEVLTLRHAELNDDQNLDEDEIFDDDDEEFDEEFDEDEDEEENY